MAYEPKKDIEMTAIEAGMFSDLSRNGQTS
jgi:hypothetical protein